MDKNIYRNERAAAGWMGVAVAALLASGLFAFLPVLARVPALQAFFDDPMLARRCLVVHVTLALQVWFLAFLGTLSSFASHPKETVPRARFGEGAGSLIAGTGLLALVLSGFLPSARPVLANYIPVLDHPLFIGGLLAVLAGAGIALLPAARGLLVPPAPADTTGATGRADRAEAALPHSARCFLGAAALAFLAAIVTLGVSAWTTPLSWQPSAYYEHVFWGAGHAFQFAHVAGMLAAWLMLSSRRSGSDPLSPLMARNLALVLVAPLVAAPVLAAFGPEHPQARHGFTLLMQWGLFPVTLIVLAAIGRNLLRRPVTAAPRAAWRSDVSATGLVSSVVLALAGFLLGAAIRGSSTLVPAHYHAAIGAVTAAYMAVTWQILPRLGFATTSSPRRIALQPMLFAAGQLLFAIGFGYAGIHGMARKVYGAEQHVRSAAEWVGLSVMGLGGLVAIIGGVLFLTLVLKAAGSRLFDALVFPLPFTATQQHRRNP